MTTPVPHSGVADVRKETQIQKGLVCEPRGTIHSLSIHCPGSALENERPELFTRSFRNNPSRERGKIEIEFLLGWVLHNHMRDCLGRTRLWGFSPDEDDCAGGRHLYPPLPEGEGVLIKEKKSSWHG